MEGEAVLPLEKRRTDDRAHERRASLAALSWWLFAGILLGALLAPVFASAVPGTVFLGTLLLVLIIALTIRRGSRFRVGFVLIGLIAGLAIGGWRYVEWAQTPISPVLLSHVGERAVVEGKVSRLPERGEKNTKIVVSIEKVATAHASTSQRAQGLVLLYAARYPDVSIGDRIRSEGKLAFPETFAGEAGRVVEYPAMLASRGIFVVQFQPAVVVLAEAEAGILPILSRVRDRLVAGIRRVIPDPSASLAEGMVFGGAERLGERLGDAFRLSGLSHLVVLSGYNVALVASWIGAALSLFGFRARVYGGVLGIIGFVLLAGAGAPAIRAGIMASLALLAQVAGRQTQAIRLILIAGAGMTLVSPASVAFDLSFQLSFLAALGIAVFSPVFGERLPHAFPKFFRDALAATLATQVVVLPLLLFRIGLLSPYALLANLLAVPLVPIAMIASMTTGFVALLLPELAVLPGIVAYGALIAILLIAEYVPRLPYAGVTVPVFSLSIVLVCYGFLTLAAWHFTELSKSAARQRIRYPHGVPLSAPRR